ncbi:phosphatase PAP2 family protein [Streptomyces mobaraensis NBRC 13819 = DSM 40847]|uniref:Phosphatase PAP2 family protein n=2 Tax=Streptomyces mobaraensis TaxID=35621 RepID=A0A5N5WDT2_STRMB|nr:phosphatase PAP2 family protein [Streptomyces mobaraensis]QTT73951.1 phosphatase PAP2 family protein [Streptomyces mobaraensis NBRC 13819 = DSM 40847]
MESVRMYRTASLGKRPRWWTELPLIAVVYALYSAGRLLVRGDVQSAVDHGVSILDIEKQFRINFEHPLNRLFTDHAILGVPADFVYASLHYVVTPAILVWVFRRHSEHYRRGRTWLMLSTLIGLVGFTLLPTCPPRLLPDGYGFVDTMHQYSSYGWWGGDASAPRGLGGLTNQYAAMPSLHVGWALWCGVMLWRHGRGTWAKVLGVAYPLTITLVVMGTANHYFLDAVAGAAVMGVGLLLTRPALRLGERLRARAPRSLPSLDPVGPAGMPESPAIVSAGCETSPRTAHPRTTASGMPAGGGRPGAPERQREADGSEHIPSIPSDIPRQARGGAGGSRPDGAPAAAR